MGRHGQPIRWVAATLVALTCLLAAIFLLPLERLAWLMRGSRPHPVSASHHHAPALHLLPSIVVESASPGPEVEQERPHELPPTFDPGWWRQAWRFRLQEEADAAFGPAPVDSSPAWRWLLTAPVAAPLVMRPDTSLAARLELLRLDDAAAFARQLPLLRAQIHSERLHAMLRQAARVHDEFPGPDIEVPDKPPR
jgi:hypothetical protein